MTRFISPDTPSTVRAREASSRPSAPKESAESRQITRSESTEPRIGTPNASSAKPSSAPTSRTSSVSRERTNDARNWGLDIGVAISRLRSRLRRASTMVNPSPQMPLPIRFMPSSPGTTKST
jgi:hypothetical protein